MTTKEYEPEDLIKALELSGAQAVGNISTDNARDALILLGLTVKPENPEPGTWWIVADGPNAGKVARANEYAGLSLYGDDGQMWSYTDCDSWPALTPARVVTAEQPVLTEEEVGELWDEHSMDLSGSWSEMSPTEKAEETRVVNAAIAEHGHGRAEVTREPLMQGDILDVIHAALGEHGEQACLAASRAVWDLLGGDRG